MASRLLWFGIGAIAGSAYASRLISKERLDLPPGTETRYRVASIKTEKKEGPKLKAARMLEERSASLADALARQACQLAGLIQVRGQELAERLRSQGQGQGQSQGATEDVLIADSVGRYPAFGSPTSAREQVAATYGTGSGYGLEEHR